MLERIHIRGFKSLRDVEVELAPLVVVFGPNAAGKSNFLEVLVLLSRLIGERTLADAFESGIRGYPLEAFSLPPEGMDALMKQAQASLALDARVRLPVPEGRTANPKPENQDRIHYKVGVQVTPVSGELGLSEEYLARESSRGTLRGSPSIELMEGKLHIRRKSKASHPFTEKTGIGHTLVSNRQYSGAEHFPNLDALRAEVGTWRVVYLDPREAMRRAQPPRETQDIGERGELLVPFLHRLSQQHPKAFAAVLRGVRAVIPSVEAITTELVPTRGEIDLKVKQDGAWMSARVLSEGTLRVMALCAMAANPAASGLLAFEEPENGVHPRRIEVITSLLASVSRRRQVVVTTHSPLVVGQISQMIRSGEIEAQHVRLLRCSAAGQDGTRLRPFDSLGPIFEDEEVRKALAATDDSDLIQAMLVRGWLE